MDAQVLVVGAGAAGLGVAMMLQSAGFSVTVLEASDHIGGRVRAVEVPGYESVEVGGEFIHEIDVYKHLFPDHAWKTHKLITWAQGDGPATYIPDQLTLFWIESDKRLINSVDYSDVVLDQNGELKEQRPPSSSDALVNQIKQSNKINEDIDNLDFRSLPPTMSMKQYLQDKLHISHPAVLDLVNAGFSNTYCSNSDDLKIRQVVYYSSLFEEEEEHDADYRLDKGFSKTVIPHIANGLHIIRNWKVTAIDRSRPGLVCVTNDKGQELKCERVVVCKPYFSIIKLIHRQITPTHQLVREISFVPPLPKEFVCFNRYNG